MHSRAKFIQRVWREHRRSFKLYSLSYNTRDWYGEGNEIGVVLWAKSEAHAMMLFKKKYKTDDNCDELNTFNVSDMTWYASQRRDFIAEITGYLEER